MTSSSSQAAVIDLGDIEEMEIEDDMRSRKEEPKSKDPMSSIRDNMTSYVFSEGKRRAQTAFKTYTNIDMLRPYFDVEPYEVLKRLGRAFVPVNPRFSEQGRTKMPAELYGPTMICFTLVALLLFQMKSSGHIVQEGTLMGSALITCLGYWTGISALFTVVAYVCNSHVRSIQILTMLGYGLTGHCLVVLLNTIIHTAHSHMFFYFTWVIFGGLSSLRMITLMMSRTPGRTERLVLSGLIASIHLMFLLYLHFAYHKVVRDLAEVLNDPLPQKPAHRFDLRQGPEAITGGLVRSTPSPSPAAARRLLRPTPHVAKLRVTPLAI